MYIFNVEFSHFIIIITIFLKNYDLEAIVFVVKIIVERCDEFFVAVPQIFDRVKSVALYYMSTLY
jgi:hypothetical protein